MNTSACRILFRPLLLAALALGATWPAFAQTSASAQLQWLDKTTFSGRIEAIVDAYPVPDAKGGIAAPERYPVEVLFERPDRYRVVLRPGTKQELRIAAEAGIVRWYDLATGLSGKEQADDVSHPLALALLATVGELSRFGTAVDLPAIKNSPLRGARLDPKRYGAGVLSAIAWFGSEDQLVGLDIQRSDGSRLFLAVRTFDRNVQTSPDDFRL
jgi:hypothetical protein